MSFVHMQSSSTGLPENMCRANMEKIAFVLSRMDEILDALTRGLDLEIFTRGYGVEDRGVTVSYQAQTPVLGAVLPSNSPGVHTLWLPAIPLQIGLALKPGSSEPWTPYRVAAALIAAGVPDVAFGLYPGGHDAGATLLTNCPRSHDVRQPTDGRTVRRQSPRPGPRTRLFEDPAGRRPGGRLGMTILT